MMRLTEKDNLGHWFLKGLEWEQLRAGQVLTKDVAERLYGALFKLKDYEDTGCNPDDVERLNDFTQNEAAKLLTKLNAEEKKHKWIPVEERLPEANDYILLSFSNFTLPAIGRYEDSEWYLGDDWGEETCINEGFNVNAWMPLPEPYRKGTEHE